MTAAHPQRLPVRRQGFEPDGSERWFVLIGQEQCGPFTAAEMAQRLDSGAIDWTTAVWRDGFKGWRAARRDAVLVTSIAGERGFTLDTVPLNSAGSFMAPEDTVVDHAPPEHDGRRPPRVSPPGGVGSRGPLADVPTHAGPRPLGPLDHAADADRQGAPVTSFRLWGSTIRLPHSFISVAAVSFATGVLAAALWARFAGPANVKRMDATLAPPAAAAPSHPVPAVPAPLPAGPPPEAHEAPGADDLLRPDPPDRELPKSREIRKALREVAPEVRQCLADTGRAADMLIHLDGPSGRVRNVQLRGPTLGPERSRCVVSAVRQLQIEPFRRSELVYPYRFAW